jgi:serine kinase of HPr protein (carbohydrate metabolism regulator)
MSVVLASRAAERSTVHDTAYGVRSIGAVMMGYVAVGSTRVVVLDIGLAAV